MSKAVIKLSYRQVIDASSTDAFAKQVFDYSYNEYCLKSQAYNLNGVFTTLTKLKANDGRANSLHYKCGFAIAGFITTLNNKIPTLNDNTGTALPFDTYKFEVLESNSTNKEIHQVAIHYITTDIMLLEIIGDTLLLSNETDSAAIQTSAVETFMLSMQPGISIIQYREISPSSKVTSYTGIV
ncbi:MAG: hypothetical protein ABJB11_06455 [Ferruginibacter sp.]